MTQALGSLVFCHRLQGYCLPPTQVQYLVSCPVSDESFHDTLSEVLEAPPSGSRAVPKPGIPRSANFPICDELLVTVGKNIIML